MNDVPRELLKKLSGQEDGKLATAFSVRGDKIRIDFGETVDWLEMDAAHADIFIASLMTVRQRLGQTTWNERS
jgi:plastocyanin